MNSKVTNLVELASKSADFRAEFLGDPEGVCQDYELTLRESEDALAQISRLREPVGRAS